MLGEMLVGGGWVFASLSGCDERRFDMPAGRFILKSISQSRKLANLKSDGARLLYSWLIPHLDINGNFYGDPVIVNSLIFTRLGKGAEEIEGYLRDLERVGLIIRYEVKGERYLTVPDFKDKQPRLYPDREGRPSIPKMERQARLLTIEEEEGKKDGEVDMVKEAIKRWNEITGQRREVTVESRRLISKILKRGYKMEVVERVIRYKLGQWGKDEKMRKYIRPATIFAEARFEDYVNEVEMVGSVKEKRVGEGEKRMWDLEEWKSWRATVEREIRKHIKDEKEVEEKLKEWEKNNPYKGDKR